MTDAHADLEAARYAAGAYGLADAAIEPLTGGLINTTFRVRDGARAVVLQRLHPVFAPEVNLDIEFVTAHLAAHGLDTPRLVRTADGSAWLERDGEVWRVITYVEGVTVHAVPDPSWAEAAGALVGRFHRALDSLDYTYQSVRSGVHDTSAHLERLRARLAADPTGDERVLADARTVGQAILREAADLPALGALPLRHAHGDLKISNVLFDPHTPAARARCLVDLDTLGRQSIAYELGDALRSWCNARGEDAGQLRFDPEIYRAAVQGYDAGADGLLTDAEREALLPGARTVCVELAARFCVDVFDDAYFGWDPDRYPSRRVHNLVRAKGQLALARSVAKAS